MDISLIEESAVAIRDNVDEIEKILLDVEQEDCPVYHHFHPGIYMREVHIKKGTFAIGHYQKTRHTTFFFKGKAKFILEDGSVELWEAPMMYVADPGRKIAYALEDMVWFNVYPTDERDIETLEATYLDKSDYFESVQQQYNHLAEQDRDDFKRVIKEYGLCEKTVRKISENETDLIQFPEGVSTVGIFDSMIEGKGLFTMANIGKGEIIAPGRISGKRTPAGRYVNHSVTPNATIDKAGDNINFVALRNISGCRGGAMGEEITIDYREALNLVR